MGKAYFGVVKGYSAEKGWGHINCEATKAYYGKDVFLMSGQLEQAGGSASAGTLISFKVSEGAKGPQANDVHILPSDAFGVDGSPGKEYGATVKSFNADRGWGFVTGDELMSVFG